MKEEGNLYPAGIGYDINCGVLCCLTNISKGELEKVKKELSKELQEKIKIANDSKNLKQKFGNLINFGNKSEIDIFYSMIENGLNLLVDNENLERVEDFGSKVGMISNKFLMENTKLFNKGSVMKAISQLGTLGQGNHYAEIQYVDEIFSNCFNIKKDQVVFMIHSGSRGFGKKICESFLQESYPINSIEGKDYINKMNLAANYAYFNRRLIMENIISLLIKYFPNLKYELLSDTSHNLGRYEEELDCFVMRKGSSRTLPPFHNDLPECFKNTGLPFSVGGSMGTSSYILVGGERSKDYLYSAMHGSGRIYSRSQIKKKTNFKKLSNDLKKQNIIVKYSTEQGLVEEAPESYKDIDILTEYAEKIKMAKRICRLKPIIVIKG